MKRPAFFIAVILFLCVTLLAVSVDEMAVDFVKTLIKKSLKGDNGSLDALRYFQYTATTAEKNPSSFVLSVYGRMALNESGIKESDKEKMISVLEDRSSERIKKLWDRNKNELLKMFPVEKYNQILKHQIDSLIKCHESSEYTELIKKIKVQNPVPDITTVEKAGMISNWSWYRELSFWHRRVYEKNDDVVYLILKELQNHYK
ncbi:MAG TPA: hypothetical protein PK358_05050 [Spirochaetota bacterium]|nr:hypothetical protein [Spirochaetota bacterium]HPJ34181.1 hypothetical protein [Spirochaetota bacterium]